LAFKGLRRSAGYPAVRLAKAEDKNVTIQVSTNPPNRIVLELLDANGAPVSLDLDRQQAFAVMGLIAQGVNALPADPAAPLHLQRAALKSTNPSFQVGIADGGNIVLAIMPTPFPSLEFEFDAPTVSKLIADLRKATNVPSHPTGRAN
jgi:hypothetical protein